MNKEYVLSILYKLGIDPDNDPRWDDNSTLILTKQLEEIEKTLYRTLYPELMAAKFVPVKTGYNKGTKNITYRMLDEVGACKLLDEATYATDLPSVGLLMEEFTVPVRGFGNKYHWSVQDIRRAAMAEIALDTDLAEVARRAVAYFIDDMMAFGQVSASMYGILNHPNVNLVSPITGTWSSATVLQRVEDVRAFINATNNQMEGVSQFQVNQVTMSTIQMQQLNGKLSTSDGTKTTGLSMLKEYFPEVTFDTWIKTKLADAAGTGPRMVAYHKSNLVLKFPVVIAFETFPAQAVDLRFQVPCHGRAGGLMLHFAPGIAYMDGC